MRKENKTYTDLFLDNAENNLRKKKRGKYFDDREQEAILKYNDPATSDYERGVLFETIIGPTFKLTVSGVMEMKKFRRLPRSMNREMLFDDTYDRLVEKLGKFTPELIGQNGQPVKAFSYFSTVAKNFILEKRGRHERVLLNKADVEQTIDLTMLSEHTLKKMSNYDKTDINFEDYETSFASIKNVVIDIIMEVLRAEEAKSRQDKDLILVGYHLKYVLEHWNNIEFVKKNEFMRILTMFTGLKQQQVSFIFKKFKTAVLKKLRPDSVSKLNKRKKSEKNKKAEESEETSFDLIFDNSDDEIVEEAEVVEETEETEEKKYQINSFEQFEIAQEKEKNDKLKSTITFTWAPKKKTEDENEETDEIDIEEEDDDTTFVLSDPDSNTK